jgi:hypothetical protein
LVEAMCAMAIAAMALVALFRGLGSSQIAANYLEAHLGARIIAQSIIADERAAVETVVGARSGDSGIYRWRLTVEPAEVLIAGSSPSILRLYRVSVDVRWEPRGSFTLDGLKAGN